MQFVGVQGLCSCIAYEQTPSKRTIDKILKKMETKKKYQTPKMTAYNLKPQALLAGSGNINHEGNAPGTLSLEGEYWSE